MNSTNTTFEKLVEIMAALRGPGGCPWDKKQTHESLKACLLEETYEVLEAIDVGVPEALKEELGDLLLQVVFHAQMAREAGDFGIEDILNQLNDKLIRRHPHVFAPDDKNTESTPDAETAILNWEKIKSAERSQQKNAKQGLFAGLPKELPALLRAYRIGGKAARVGFDWPDVNGVWEKVREEIDEFEGALSTPQETQDKQAAMEEEFGDLLFSLAQVGRFFKVNPEEALRKATLKFQRRFAWMETRLSAQQKDIHQINTAEWEALWQQAKKHT